MVKIHPKDSGPIDTHTHVRCDNCNGNVAKQGKRCYNGDKSKGRRKTKSWHSTYYNVCPHCKNSLRYHAETIKCGNCSAYVDQLELINVSWKSRDTKCPCCKEKVTEDNSKIV